MVFRTGYTRPTPTATYQQFDAVEKSASDDRVYRLIKLDNNLEALLISDPNTDKSAAALDVRVGSLFDPPHVQGLAHFCEHMVFLGTDKYPQENAYSVYLAEHGGHSNAYTALENTNYFFEVSHDALEGALDRFAQFFIAPRFDSSCTDREMLAVDSENKKNLQSDMWRLYQLEKALADTKHPYNKFSTGNITTLKEWPQRDGVDVRKELLAFHAKYYSANLMKLAVLGKEPLDVLTKWTVDMFAPVPNKDVEAPVAGGYPYKKEQFLREVRVRPVKEKRTLEVAWPFPDFKDHYNVKPEKLASHLLGHEGPGSLLSLLKRKGLANNLSAGAGGGATGFDFFKVSIELTEEGLEQYESIVCDVFRYIQLLRNGIEPRIFEEVRDFSDINFRFAEKTHPSDYTSHMASHMHVDYPAAHVISGNYLVREYNPQLMQEAIGSLRADNFWHVHT